MKRIIFLILLVQISINSFCSQLLIPMDASQKNHLKAYGLAYFALKHDIEIYWLLNYRGGSFMFRNDKVFIDECNIRGISYEVIPDAKSTAILQEISNPFALVGVITNK